MDLLLFGVGIGWIIYVILALALIVSPLFIWINASRIRGSVKHMETTITKLSTAVDVLAQSTAKELKTGNRQSREIVDALRTQNPASQPLATRAELHKDGARQTIACPNCDQMIAGTFRDGQAILCPHCQDTLELTMA